MAQTIFTSKKIKNLRFSIVLEVLPLLVQYSRGSLKTSSLVTVQAMQEMGIASIKSERICVDKLI